MPRGTPNTSMETPTVDHSFKLLNSTRMMSTARRNPRLSDSIARAGPRRRDSAYVFAGNLDYEFSEGDVLVIFSQFGELTDVNLVRDKETGKSKAPAHTSSCC